MIWLAIFFVVFCIAVIAVIMLSEQLEQNQKQVKVDKYFDKGYKDSPDWSLMVKGYPVVNDVDIQYSEWLAANPGKVI